MKNIVRVLLVLACFTLSVSAGAETNQVPNFFDSGWTYHTSSVNDWNITGTFPADFMWGTAIAAHQVEGNNTNNDWWNFEQTNITVAYKSGIASDHFRTEPRQICREVTNGCDTTTECETIEPHRNGDFDRAKNLGMNTFRMSLEWSRIEPQRGVFSASATAYYREYIQQLINRGLKPSITLWHFSLPQWVQQPSNMGASLGGWPNPETVTEFVEYAEYCAANFGDLVDIWVTENEPVGTLMVGFMSTYFPPGYLLDLENTKKAVLNAARAHNAAYDAIKLNDTVDADGDGKKAEVGLVKHFRKLKPNDLNWQRDIDATKKLEYWYHVHQLDAAITGKLDTNFDGNGDEVLQDGTQKLDFIGVNYYSTYLVGPDFAANVIARASGPMEVLGGAPWVSNNGNPGFPRNSLGWEIYPQGFYDVLMDVHNRYGQFNIPIYITENGMPDPEGTGTKRTQYLISHFQMMLKAIQAGVDIRGYYYWTLFDNFEWREGFEPKAHFGLFGVEHSEFAETFPTDTLRRFPTSTVQHLTGIIQDNGITQTTINTHGTFPQIPVE